MTRYLHPEDLALVLDELSDALTSAAGRLRKAGHHREPEPIPAAEATPMPDWMTTADVAEWIRMRPQSLRKLRLTGGGPPYIRLGEFPNGRVLYKKTDVESWLLARRFPHTSAESASIQIQKGGS